MFYDHIRCYFRNAKNKKVGGTFAFAFMSYSFVIKQDTILATEELAKIVGDDIKLLNHVQLPIALMETYRFYQSNTVSHDQSTRKIKVDNDNGKVLWE